MKKQELANKSDTEKKSQVLRGRSNQRGSELGGLKLEDYFKQISVDSSPEHFISMMTSPNLSHSVNASQKLYIINQLQRTYGNANIQRVIQAKLKIGQPNDKYEQEADRIAEEVMRMPEPEVRTQHIENEELQHQPIKEKEGEKLRPRLEEQEEEGFVEIKASPGGFLEVTHDLEAPICGFRRDGRPLSESNRLFFETRFGCDLGEVRIHFDNDAAKMAKGLGAKAFTVGRHIVLGEREATSNADGYRRLLAHEITHVFQQKGLGPRIQMTPYDGAAQGGESLLGMPSGGLPTELVQGKAPTETTAEVIPTKNELNEHKKERWEDVVIHLKHIYNYLILRESAAQMEAAYKDELKKCFRELEDEQELEKTEISLITAPVTVIPFVGSALQIYLEEIMKKLNELSWPSVEQLKEQFENVIDSQKIDMLFGKDTAGRREFLNEIKLYYFDEEYSNFSWDWRNIGPQGNNFLDEFVENVKPKCSKFVIEKDTWRRVFYETLGPSVKVLINRTLLMRPEIRQPLPAPGLILPPTTNPWVVEEVKERGYGIDYQQQAFKIVFYQTVIEARDLEKNDPFNAPEKWHSFLTYCKKEGPPQGWLAEDPEISRIAYQAESYHIAAVAALSNYYLEGVLEREKRWSRKMEADRSLSREEKSKTLMDAWEQMRKRLLDIIGKEQNFNRYLIGTDDRIRLVLDVMKKKKEIYEKRLKPKGP